MQNNIGPVTGISADLSFPDFIFWSHFAPPAARHTHQPYWPRLNDELNTSSKTVAGWPSC